MGFDAMVRQFEGETADDVWRDAAITLIEGDDFLRQDSRAGRTREHLHCCFHVHNPLQRWVLSRQPAINPAFAIAELIWILQGRNDAAFVNYWNPSLPKYAGAASAYHGAYGYRLRQSLGIDQLERAYRTLTANPDSRQVVLQIWDSGQDFPQSSGHPTNPDIPCNLISMLKIRSGALDWSQIIRSNDLFLGTPHNFLQFTSLQEVIAGWIGVNVGSYVQLSDSLHVYEHDLEAFNISTKKICALNVDKLGLPKREFDEMLIAVGMAMDELRSDRLTISRFCDLVGKQGIPLGWHNLLCIAAADAARRRSWAQEMEMAAGACTNPALAVAWQRWAHRIATKIS